MRKYIRSTSIPAASQSAPHAADGSLLPQSEHYPPIANARRRVASLRERGLSGRLLDLGCGVGYFVLAAQRGFDAEGMEIEDTAIEKARKDRRLGAAGGCSRASAARTSHSMMWLRCGMSFPALQTRQERRVDARPRQAGRPVGAHGSSWTIEGCDLGRAAVAIDDPAWKHALLFPSSRSRPYFLFRLCSRWRSGAKPNW